MIPHGELVQHVAGKDAIFCNLTDKVDAAVIEAAGPNLKVIATMSVGYVSIAHAKSLTTPIAHTIQSDSKR